MKTKVVFLLSVVLFFTGCAITSLHPLFTQKDLIFKEDLVGKWTEGDESVWKFEKYYYTAKDYYDIFGLKPSVDTITKIPHNSYLITYYEKGNMEPIKLHGHLVKLNNVYFIDFNIEDEGKYIDNTMLLAHLFPVHTFAKVEFKKNEIKILWFNDEWLSDLIKKNKIKIKHETTEFGKILLTANTEELQKFVIKYCNDEEAFKETATQKPSILKQKI